MAGPRTAGDGGRGEEPLVARVQVQAAGTLPAPTSREDSEEGSGFRLVLLSLAARSSAGGGAGAGESSPPTLTEWTLVPHVGSVM